MKSIVIRMAVATALCAASAGGFAATSWGLTDLPANNPLVTGWKASTNAVLIGSTTVDYWSGNGVGVGGESSSDGQHSLDNQSGFEVALLSFDQQVRLESVRAGWTQTDSDIFVMVFTGFGSLTAQQSLDGGTFSNLASRGWSLVGNYADIGLASKSLGTTAGAFADTYSSFWLIGAGGFIGGSGVNSGDIESGSAVAFGTCPSGSNTVCGKYDYLKLASVTGTIKSNNGGGGSVPEPGSLALAGLAFMGMVGVRRRKQAA